MPSPRVLISIDYESWFALSRRFDHLPAAERRWLDDGFARQALDPILEQLNGAQASFYLVGELVDWYPDLPEKLLAAGHEVGFHCQVHRPLNSLAEIEQDLRASTGWRRQYDVRGFRAPMINTIETVYPLLEDTDFCYSSSIYAPTGSLVRKGQIWEIPVSTRQVIGKTSPHLIAPRNMTLPLLLGGEFPYGSSLMVGLFEPFVLKIIEQELRSGLSPVIFLHPYELFRPNHFTGKLTRDLLLNPLLLPFTFDKSGFLKRLLREFSVSRLDTYLHEALKENPNA